MSNTTTIMIPLAISFVLLPPEKSHKTIPLIIALSASCDLLLTVSMPPNAIAYGTGQLEQSDFRFGGVLIGVLGPILVCVWVILLELL